MALEGADHRLGERQHIQVGDDVAVHVQRVIAVVLADADLVEQVIADLGAVGCHIVGILHIFGLGNGLAVDIDDAVLDLQGLARQAQTAFHVVVAAVDRTIDDVAEDVLVVAHHITAALVAQGVVVGVGHLQGHGVAGGEIEHHDVHALDIAQTFQAVVLELRLVDIGLAVKEGQRVLCQREVQRRLRHTGAVHHLVYPQEIACQQ